MVILSDLSEVLIRGLWGSEEYLAKIYGHEASEKFLNRHQAINSTFQELLRGKITEDDYWREFFRVGHYPFDAAESRAAFRWNLKRTIDGTLDVYKRICAYPTALRADQQITQPGRPPIFIVSDHIRERLPEVMEYHRDLFEFVDKVIWSCDIGKIKLDDDFFPTLLEDEALKTSETIFIDDFAGNVQSAARSGIMSIQFLNAIQLETVLKGYGFQFAPKK